MNLRNLAIFAFVVVVQATVEPTEPELCTDENQGRCDCGDQSLGFYTFTFWQEEVQRCFTVFYPLERVVDEVPEQLAVVFSPHCYSKDKLNGKLSMTNTKAADNKAAARYGYVRVAVSTPFKDWTWGNDGVSNDTYPMACADEDSPDIAYIRKVFTFLESQPQFFDMTRVYAEGFSQNSVFSAYIGYCFADNVRGIYQGGSGLFLTEQPFTAGPSCVPSVKVSDLKNPDVCSFKNGKPDCKSCVKSHPCTECQYFPIYPCYSPKRPMVHCVIEYDNDPIATKTITKPKPAKYYSSGKNMYEAASNEGQDVRLFRFSKSEDGTIKGKHSDLQNLDYWQVGCMGITAPCSEECEVELVACVENGDISTALKRTKTFSTCMDPETFSGFSSCTLDCAPTLGMMSASQAPTEMENTNWGAGSDAAVAKPDTSICDM